MADASRRIMIEAAGLSKYYGPFVAIKDVSFSIPEGQIVSFLGPNGAGKSTTMKILAGYLAASEGTARIAGFDMTTQRLDGARQLGYLPENGPLYNDMTPIELLRFFGEARELEPARLKSRVDAVIAQCSLEGVIEKPIGKLSRGYRQRVGLAQALLHDPAVLIMDEPTVGIDPQSRRHILDNVKELNRRGMTVLYTTHYMEEAAELSDHIVIMDQGRVIAQGTHAELIKLVGEQTRIDLTLSTEATKVLGAWQQIEGVSQTAGADGQVSVLVDDSNRALPRLFEEANRMGVRITTVDIQEPNLESVFLHLTGKALRD